MSREDRRLQTLERIMREHNYQKNALLEILHTAHELYGYFDKNLLAHITERMNLPPSHVYGVASFYNLFKFRKPGEHIISACMGTACYVKGVEEIISAIEKEFNVKRGSSTPEGRLSLFVTRCIGACAMAPNIIIDNEVVGRATKEVVLERIKRVLGG
ncbi:MAG: NAD(P)H-dependent oxidoreductase subunit E [Candidatus Bathyarchaeia archaeon]